MLITRSFTLTYHLYTNGQFLRLNPSPTAMLRSYVQYHPQDWCPYIPTHCFVYNMRVHSASYMTPFQLVFSRPKFHGRFQAVDRKR